MPDSIQKKEDINSQENTIAEIKLAVEKLCQEYPGEYWRELDRDQKYPTEFVKALTESGFQ